MVLRSEPLPLTAPAAAIAEQPPAQLEDSMLTAVGYVARKQAGRGFFIDGQMIDRQAARFSELLRSVPGFRVVDGCASRFIDGALWASTTPGQVDDFVRPADVLALEAYDRSNVPSQFLARDAGDCPPIVAWTRARMTKR